MLLVTLLHPYLELFLVEFSFLGLHHIVLMLCFCILLSFLEFLNLISIVLLYLLVFSKLLSTIFSLAFLHLSLDLVHHDLLLVLLVSFVYLFYDILFLALQHYLFFDENIHFYIVILLLLMEYLNHLQILNGLQIKFQVHLNK